MCTSLATKRSLDTHLRRCTTLCKGTLFPIGSLLVENRADVKAVFKFREKPFHRAVSLGYEDIAPF